MKSNEQLVRALIDLCEREELARKASQAAEVAWHAIADERVELGKIVQARLSPKAPEGYWGSRVVRLRDGSVFVVDPQGHVRPLPIEELGE